MDFFDNSHILNGKTRVICFSIQNIAVLVHHKRLIQKLSSTLNDKQPILLPSIDIFGEGV